MKKFEAPEIRRFPIVIKDEITVNEKLTGGDFYNPSNDLEVPEDKV